MRDAPNARDIVEKRGGRWRGRSGMCFCPAHDDGRHPSLSVTAQTTGFVLIHCFGGCPQGAVIAALRAQGLWPEGGGDGPVYAPSPSSGSVDQDAIKRRRLAQELWIKGRPAAGTLVETYLKGRGIRRTADALRFMPSLRHHSGTSWPCMLGAITNAAGAVLAVQRTWLARDGRGKAPVTPAKMTLGPMDDGAVRFGSPLASVGLAEGIETALSAKQIYSRPVWAVLGGARFTAVALPDTIEDVHIFADRGDAGWKFANAAAAHYEAQGRHVEIILPQRRDAKDFNEELQARAGAGA